MARRPAERGRQGDHGQQGEVGPAGPRGRGLTWAQALAVFGLVVLIVFVLSWRSEIQTREIRENTLAIESANYDRCVAGVEILRHFNDQQDALAKIERDLANASDATPAGRRTAAARVEAYEAARVLPLPVCMP